MGTGTLPSVQFPQEAGQSCCSPFSGQGHPQIDTVGAMAAGAQAYLPTPGCGVHGVGGGGRYDRAFFFLPRCPGSRAGKWRGRKGMPVACPSWRPWTPSCPPHAPQTSPCVCHCRMCTRLAVSEGPGPLPAAAPLPTWPALPSDPLLRTGPRPGASRAQLFLPLPPCCTLSGGPPFHLSPSIHPSVHPSIPSVQPYASTSATGESFITLHLEVPILQETPSTLGMRRAGHAMMQTHKQV